MPNRKISKKLEIQCPIGNKHIRLEIKEIQIKPKWDTIVQMPVWVKLKRFTISSIGKVLKQ